MHELAHFCEVGLTAKRFTTSINGAHLTLDSLGNQCKRAINDNAF